MRESYSAKQVYYGAFTPENKEMLIEEYKAAVAGSLAEEKTFTIVSSVFAAIASALTFVVSIATGKLISINILNTNSNVALLIVIIMYFIILFVIICCTRHFAYAHKKLSTLKEK